MEKIQAALPLTYLLVICVIQEKENFGCLWKVLTAGEEEKKKRKI